MSDNAHDDRSVGSDEKLTLPPDSGMGRHEDSEDLSKISRGEVANTWLEEVGVYCSDDLRLLDERLGIGGTSEPLFRDFLYGVINCMEKEDPEVGTLLLHTYYHRFKLAYMSLVLSEVELILPWQNREGESVYVPNLVGQVAIHFPLRSAPPFVRPELNHPYSIRVFYVEGLKGHLAKADSENLISTLEPKHKEVLRIVCDDISCLRLRIDAEQGGELWKKYLEGTDSTDDLSVFRDCPLKRYATTELSRRIHAMTALAVAPSQNHLMLTLDTFRLMAMTPSLGEAAWPPGLLEGVAREAGLPKSVFRSELGKYRWKANQDLGLYHPVAIWFLWTKYHSGKGEDENFKRLYRKTFLNKEGLPRSLWFTLFNKGGEPHVLTRDVVISSNPTPRAQSPFFGVGEPRITLHHRRPP